MGGKWILVVLVMLVAAVTSCSAVCPSAPGKDVNDANTVTAILEQLKKKTSELQTYKCDIEYLFSQPLLESKTLKKGMLYYARLGDKSKLRINFETLKQDDEPQKQYREHYIFDGQWLTQIDYQLKQIKKRQLAEPNEIIDAFELVKRNFPIVGFSSISEMEKDFEVSLVAEPNQAEHLHLKVKPDSTYKDDYSTVDFWIDSVIGLPARIVAVSTQEDIYDIRLLDPAANKPMDEKVFKFEIPNGFSKPEIIPLSR